jgi:hypothetical protein
MIGSVRPALQEEAAGLPHTVVRGRACRHRSDRVFFLPCRTSWCRSPTAPEQRPLSACSRRRPRKLTRAAAARDAQDRRRARLRRSARRPRGDERLDGVADWVVGARAKIDGRRDEHREKRLRTDERLASLRLRRQKEKRSWFDAPTRRPRMRMPGGKRRVPPTGSPKQRRRRYGGSGGIWPAVRPTLQHGLERRPWRRL